MCLQSTEVFVRIFSSLSSGDSYLGDSGSPVFADTPRGKIKISVLSGGDCCQQKTEYLVQNRVHSSVGGDAMDSGDDHDTHTLSLSWQAACEVANQLTG